MTTYYRHDAETGELVMLYRPMMRALLSQGETIDALIDRAIEKLPKDAQGFVLEASVTPDVVTVAVGFRFRDDWTISLGADMRKDGKPAGHVTVTHSW